MSETVERERVEDLLAGVPFFAELSRRSLRSLGKLCVRRRFAAGKRILEEGDLGLGMYIITRGRVEVFKGEGEEKVELAELERGDIIGEMALIDEKPRSASAQALEAVECLLITRDAFRTLVRRDPEIAWCIVPTLAERVRDLQVRLVEEEADDRRHTALALGEAARSVPMRESGESEGRSGGPAGEDLEDEAEVERRTAGLALLRAQHATLLAALSGVAGSVEVGGTFLRSLARQSGLAESRRARDVVRRLPSGALGALGDAVEVAERLPERMLRTFRRNWARG